MSIEVILRVYDISRGMATTLGSGLLGHPIDGIWHTGVEIFGFEYFFGGGIQKSFPSDFERENGITPSKTMSVGRTSKSIEEFESFLRLNNHRFTISTYNFLHWNCNHFSNECVKYLLNGQTIPHEILNQHEIIQRSPLGASIVSMIQNMGIANPMSESQTLPLFNPEVPDDDFGRAIKLLINNRQKDSLETLKTLASNLISHSTTSKYKIIKKSNHRIKETLLDHPGGKEALVALGFEEGEVSLEGEPPESGFEFKGVNAEKLREVLDKKKRLESDLNLHFGPSSTSLPTPVNTSQMMPPPPDYSAQLEQLTSMGFTDEETCLRILKEVSGNLNQALDQLLRS